MKSNEVNLTAEQKSEIAIRLASKVEAVVMVSLNHVECNDCRIAAKENIKQMFNRTMLTLENMSVQSDGHLKARDLIKAYEKLVTVMVKETLVMYDEFGIEVTEEMKQ